MVHHAQLVFGERAPGIADRHRTDGLAARGVRWSMVITRKSFFSSGMLITACTHTAIQEFKRPPGVASSAKPEPISA
jgi:hypothetical protein